MNVNATNNPGRDNYTFNSCNVRASIHMIHLTVVRFNNIVIVFDIYGSEFAKITGKPCQSRLTVRYFQIILWKRTLPYQENYYIYPNYVSSD